MEASDATIKRGQKIVLLERNQDTKFVKVQTSEGKEGWWVPELLLVLDSAVMATAPLHSLHGIARLLKSPQCTQASLYPGHQTWIWWQSMHQVVGASTVKHYAPLHTPPVHMRVCSTVNARTGIRSAFRWIRKKYIELCDS